ncbi:MAG: hypothetical protein AB7N99_04905 [Simkaniaceae bacterium]
MSGLTRESLVINLSVQRQGDFVVFDIKTMQDVLQIKKQKELISAPTRLILFTFGREHKIQGCLKPPELQEEYDRLFAQVEQIHACLRGEKLLHEAMQGVLSSHSRFEGRQKEDYFHHYIGMGVYALSDPKREVVCPVLPNGQISWKTKIDLEIDKINDTEDLLCSLLVGEERKLTSEETLNLSLFVYKNYAFYGKTGGIVWITLLKEWPGVEGKKNVKFLEALPFTLLAEKIVVQGEDREGSIPFPQFIQERALEESEALLGIAIPPNMKKELLSILNFENERREFTYALLDPQKRIVNHRCSQNHACYTLYQVLRVFYRLEEQATQKDETLTELLGWIYGCDWRATDVFEGLENPNPIETIPSYPFKPKEMILFTSALGILYTKNGETFDDQAFYLFLSLRRVENPHAFVEMLLTFHEHPLSKVRTGQIVCWVMGDLVGEHLREDALNVQTAELIRKRRRSQKLPQGEVDQFLDRFRLVSKLLPPEINGCKPSAFFFELHATEFSEWEAIEEKIQRFLSFLNHEFDEQLDTDLFFLALIRYLHNQLEDNTFILMRLYEERFQEKLTLSERCMFLSSVLHSPPKKLKEPYLQEREDRLRKLSYYNWDKIQSLFIFHEFVSLQEKIDPVFQTHTLMTSLVGHPLQPDHAFNFFLYHPIGRDVQGALEELAKIRDRLFFQKGEDPGMLERKIRMSAEKLHGNEGFNSLNFETQKKCYLISDLAKGIYDEIGCSLVPHFINSSNPVLGITEVPQGQEGGFHRSYQTLTPLSGMAPDGKHRMLSWIFPHLGPCYLEVSYVHLSSLRTYSFQIPFEVPRVAERCDRRFFILLQTILAVVLDDDKFSEAPSPLPSPKKTRSLFSFREAPPPIQKEEEALLKLLSHYNGGVKLWETRFDSGVNREALAKTLHHFIKNYLDCSRQALIDLATEGPLQHTTRHLTHVDRPLLELSAEGTYYPSRGKFGPSLIPEERLGPYNYRFFTLCEDVEPLKAVFESRRLFLQNYLEISLDGTNPSPPLLVVATCDKLSDYLFELTLKLDAKMERVMKYPLDAIQNPQRLHQLLSWHVLDLKRKWYSHHLHPQETLLHPKQSWYAVMLPKKEEEPSFEAIAKDGTFFVYREETLSLVPKESLMEAPSVCPYYTVAQEKIEQLMKQLQGNTEGCYSLVVTEASQVLLQEAPNFLFSTTVKEGGSECVLSCGEEKIKTFFKQEDLQIPIILQRQILHFKAHWYKRYIARFI